MPARLGDYRAYLKATDLVAAGDCAVAKESLEPVWKWKLTSSISGLSALLYNAGKSWTGLWKTWGTFREPAEFIETIPFTETRNYVRIVRRNADIYRQVYAGSD
ncbi:MAG: hypothetical protein WKF37_03220 [Bryobacteraceae bacterium]